MSEHQPDENLIQSLQDSENQRFQQWQQQQTVSYLNNRVIELGIENSALAQRISELEQQVQDYEAAQRYPDAIPVDGDREDEETYREAIALHERMREIDADIINPHVSSEPQ